MEEEIRYFRWYCKKCKRSITYDYDDDFKEEFIKKANGFFPYPIVIKHDDHYSIIQLDQQLRDRGTLETDIFIDLDKNE